MNKSILGHAYNVSSEIYEACNKFQWFTRGTTEEYEELSNLYAQMQNLKA